MKRILLLFIMALPLLTMAQGIRIQQLRSTGEPAGRIVQTDGTGSFVFADATVGGVDSVRISGNTLEIYSGGSLTPYTADLSPYLDNTDAQVFDVAQLVGTVLQLSMSGDGEATKTIDLASLQDGTGTDDQTADEVSVVVQNGIEQNNVQLELEAIRSDMATSGDGWGSDVVNHDATLNGNGTSGSPLGVNSITAAQVSDFDTEVANNAAVAANTAKVSNATHTGEVTGNGALTVSDNVIDYDNVATTLKGAATDNDGAWDFSANGIINAAFSTNTTVTFSNLQQRKDIWIKLTISSSATVTWPAYCDVDGDAIDADATYRIYAACWNAGSGTEDVHVSITKIQ